MYLWGITYRNSGTCDTCHAEDKNELKKLQASGFYVDVDLGEPQAYHSDIEERKAEEGGYSLTNDNRYSIYEVHADIIIDGVDNSDDGIAKPYIYL